MYIPSNAKRLHLVLVFFVAMLLSACAPSLESMVENSSHRLSQQLQLNPTQQEKLNTLVELVEPSLAQSPNSAARDTNILREKAKSGDDLSPDEALAVTDSLVSIYNDNRDQISFAVADFYNSLNQNQRKQSAEFFGGHGFACGSSFFCRNFCLMGRSMWS